MFKVKVYTLGRLKEHWLQDALMEYEKRLSRELQIEWIICKNNADLMQRIELESNWIALDPQGQLLDSAGFSKKFMSFLEQFGSRLCFVIGGSDGIPQQILERSRWKWSLSPLTFTHQMTRLILTEQIYRAIEINSGSSYHK